MLTQLMLPLRGLASLLTLVPQVINRFKDGDVSFAVTGDGNLVSTSATAAGVKVAVDAAKVKDLAIDAVTVSKAAQADNPITVTPTVGTNSKRLCNWYRYNKTLRLKRI